MKKGRSQLEGHLPLWRPDDTSVTPPSLSPKNNTTLPNLVADAHSTPHSRMWMKGRSDNRPSR